MPLNGSQTGIVNLSNGQYVAQTLRRYIEREMATVWGNLHPVDAACYAALMTFQSVSGVTGSAAEIGVSQGRSLFLMAKALHSGEQVFGIDLFEHNEIAQIGDGQLESFKAYARRLGVNIPDNCIHIGPSDAVEPQEILRAVGPVRFFSVDGGHMEHHLKSDSALAAATLADGGIIAFDDFCNPEWPETSLGVLDFLRGNDDGLVPFAITKDKLFVSQSAYAKRYYDALIASDWVAGFRKGSVELLGSKMVWVNHPVMDRIIYHALEKFGLGRIAYKWQARRRY